MENKEFPKISIITCTYNSAKNLRATLESVKNQTYKNIEHIFIDGGSTDETLNIIHEYYHEPILISEPDRGIYDAFNKGLKIASGEVVGFLHSDDVYFDDEALTRVARVFNSRQIDYYCSKMVIYNQQLKASFAVLGASPHCQSLKDQLYSSTYFAHPTYYCTKEIIVKVGLFNTEYRIASDIEWLYRLEKNSDKFYFDANPLIKFRGEGGTSATKYFIGLAEEFKIRRRNEGLTLSLSLIYGYHFFRRALRFILEKLKLFTLIERSRKIIIKLNS